MCHYNVWTKMPSLLHGLGLDGRLRLKIPYFLFVETIILEYFFNAPEKNAQSVWARLLSDIFCLKMIKVGIAPWRGSSISRFKTIPSNALVSGCNVIITRFRFGSYVLSITRWRLENTKINIFFQIPQEWCWMKERKCWCLSVASASVLLGLV